MTPVLRRLGTVALAIAGLTGIIVATGSVVALTRQELPAAAAVSSRSASPAPGAASVPTAPPPTAPPVPPMPVVERLRLIAVPRDGASLGVFADPTTPAPSLVLPATNELGSPLVLLAIGRWGDSLQVLLPTRPNGSTGWVREAEVTTSVPEFRVEVSTASHELRVIRASDGTVVLTSAAGIGKSSTPTPTGEFFVRDHFPTSGGNHPYGPFAFGLSGHSDVYSSFGTGDGRIAIHGTNQPGTIGADASNGCVHVPNDVVLAMIPYLPLGTPVLIS